MAATMDDHMGLDWLNSVRRLNIHITLDQGWSQPDPSSPPSRSAPPADPKASPTPATTAHQTPAISAASDDGEPAPPSRWMSLLPDSTPLSAITIPGTHDSAARLPLPFVQTQTLSITDQLEFGVRALDLRLRRDKSDGDRLYCYHGGVPLGSSPGSRLPLDDVMAEIWRFLGDVGAEHGGAVGGDKVTAADDSDPVAGRRGGETVLVLINNDDVSDGRDPAGRAAFYRAVEDYVAGTPPWEDGGTGGGMKNDADGGRVASRDSRCSSREASKSRWYTEARAPQLGEVRGRVVLLRRFPLPDPVGGVTPEAPLGLDLSAWVNDSPDFTIISPYNRFRVQDKWFYPKRVSLQELIVSKSAHVRYMIEQAAADSRQKRLRKLQRGAIESRGPDEDAADVWYINFCSAVGERLKYGEIADPRSVAAGAFVGWGRKWLDGVNTLTTEYLSNFTSSDEQACRSLGIIYMDFPELPIGSSLVQQLIQTNF